MRVQKLEKTEKTFTIEDCMKGDSQFKIAIEFEKSDEEIRSALETAPYVQDITSGMLEGQTFIEINGKYPLHNTDWDGNDIYTEHSLPLVHFDSIITQLPKILTLEPDYAHFLDEAKTYFSGFPKDQKKADRFHLSYQIARHTGSHLNVAIISPDDGTTSFIWYDPLKDRICHEEIPKAIFQKEIVRLGLEIRDFFSGLMNIWVGNLNEDIEGSAYKRLVHMCEKYRL